MSLLFRTFAEGIAVERMKVVIKPTGAVQVSVEGVAGERCHEVTRGMEAALGVVTGDQPTEELYATATNENVQGH